MIPTTMPLVPEPETDETLPSWFDRLAAANHQPLSWVLTTTHLAASDNYRDAPTNYGVFLTDEQTRGIHDATGVPEARIQQMLTSTWIGTYTTGLNHKGEPVTEAARYAQRNWIYSSGSHYCPHCLADSPTWRLAWKLPWSIACTTHGTWMETTCPHCEVRASVGRPDGQVKPGFVRHVPKPGRCGNGKPGSKTKMPCWHDLRSVTTSPAPDWVLTMQQQLDNHAHDWRLDQWRDLRALNVYTTTTLTLPHVEDILERELPTDLREVWEQQWAERLQRLEQARTERAQEGLTHWHSRKDSYARQPAPDPRLHATATAVALTTLTSDEALTKAMQYGTHAPTVIPPVDRLTGYTITPELEDRAKRAYLADRADVWEAGLLPRYADTTRTHITWNPNPPTPLPVGRPNRRTRHPADGRRAPATPHHRPNDQHRPLPASRRRHLGRRRRTLPRRRHQRPQNPATRVLRH